VDATDWRKSIFISTRCLTLDHIRVTFHHFIATVFWFQKSDLLNLTISFKRGASTYSNEKHNGYGVYGTYQWPDGAKYKGEDDSENGYGQTTYCTQHETIQNYPFNWFSKGWKKQALFPEEEHPDEKCRIRRNFAKEALLDRFRLQSNHFTLWKSRSRYSKSVTVCTHHVLIIKLSFQLIYEGLEAISNTHKPFSSVEEYPYRTIVESIQKFSRSPFIVSS